MASSWAFMWVPSQCDLCGLCAVSLGLARYMQHDDSISHLPFIAVCASVGFVPQPQFVYFLYIFMTSFNVIIYVCGLKFAYLVIDKNSIEEKCICISSA